VELEREGARAEGERKRLEHAHTAQIEALHTELQVHAINWYIHRYMEIGRFVVVAFGEDLATAPSVSGVSCARVLRLPPLMVVMVVAGAYACDGRGPRQGAARDHHVPEQGGRRGKEARTPRHTAVAAHSHGYDTGHGEKEKMAWALDSIQVRLPINIISMCSSSCACVCWWCVVCGACSASSAGVAVAPGPAARQPPETGTLEQGTHTTFLDTYRLAPLSSFLGAGGYICPNSCSNPSFFGPLCIDDVTTACGGVGPCVGQAT
jgi:hypothetical protein